MPAHTAATDTARLRYLPGEGWRDAYQRQLELSLHRLSAVQVLDVVWAAAELEVPLTLPSLNRMVSTVMSSFGIIPGAQLASLLYALVKLGAGLRPALVEQLLPEIQDQMGEMDSQMLTDLAWALATAGYAPSEPLLRALDARFEVLLPSMSAEGVAKIAAARPKLGELLPGKQWVGRLAARADELGVGSFKAGQVLLLIQGLHQLGWASEVELLRRYAAQAAAPRRPVVQRQQQD